MRAFITCGLFIGFTFAGSLSCLSAQSVNPSKSSTEAYFARQHAMQQAVETASREGTERYAAIVSAMRTAGYDLVPADAPFTWRLAAPATTTRFPLIRIELYPLDATPEAMKERFDGASVTTPQNFRLRFCIRPAGLPTDATPTRSAQALPAQLLLDKFNAALLELPEIKTLAPTIPDPKTKRARELAARVRTFQTLKDEADSWRAEYLRAGDATPDSLRARADLMERLSDTLQEAITDAQRERLGELPPPPAAP